MARGLLLLLPLLLAPAGETPVERAEALAAEKRWDDAAEVLHELLKREPGDARSHGLYGEVLAKLRRKDEAAHHFAIAMSFLEESGATDSREYKKLRSSLVKADPMANSRDAFFKKMTKSLAEAAENLLEEGHTERALKVLQRVAPYAPVSAGKEREKLLALLDEARSAFEEVRLDDAGGPDIPDSGLPPVELESERYLMEANLEPEVTQLVAETMDDVFNYYVQVYFDGDEGRAKKRKATIRIHPDQASMMTEWTGPPRSVGGWWSPGEWKVYCYDTRSSAGTLDVMLETLFHEASHQFMTMRGSTPSWLNEGTASFFEGATAMSDHRVLWPDAAAGRLVSLASMLRGKTGPTVHDVVSYDEPASYPGEYYPFGWGLVYYLQQFEDPETLEYVWRPYYLRYLEDVTTKGGGSMPLFEEVFLEKGNPGGFETFDDFAAAWEAWILETIWPLHFGQDIRALRWSEIRRYVAAGDAAAAKKKPKLSEEELLLRALGHAEFVRKLDDGAAPDGELLLLQIDLLERLARHGAAAALIEEVLELVGDEKLTLEAERVDALDERMAKLDRGNYPLRALRSRVRNLSRSAQKLLGRYEAKKDPLLLRSWSFAREAGNALEDEAELLPAADRLRAAARDAGLVPSRILGVEGDRWESVFATPPRAFEPGPNTVTAEMPALQAGLICTDLAASGEYEVRCVLAREGEVYSSTLHGVVVSGTPDGDWLAVCFGDTGKLIVKRIVVEGGGTRRKNLLVQPLVPPVEPDERLALTVRVQPEGRLRIRVGDRDAIALDLRQPLPEEGHVGVYVKDGRLTLADFVVEIFP